MRSLVLALLVACLHAAPVVRATQERATTRVDLVNALLVDLQRAVLSGSADELRKLALTDITDRQLAPFLAATRGGPPAQVVLRERTRRPLENEAEIEVVLDLLVGRGITGRVATWLVTLIPAPGSPATLRIRELRELAAIDWNRLITHAR